jgi:peroxiredoxin
MQESRIKILIVAFFIGISIPLFSQNKITHKPITVYVFLSETCPICQSYTLTLKKLHKKYSKQNVTFIGVFPNYYADADSIAAFKKKYTIPFDLAIDKNAELTNTFGAIITPEVFVETADHQILYSGRIDDSFYAVGKRRNVITSNDLDIALSEITTNKKVKRSKTQAVGCIITSSK